MAFQLLVGPKWSPQHLRVSSKGSLPPSVILFSSFIHCLHLGFTVLEYKFHKSFVLCCWVSTASPEQVLHQLFQGKMRNGREREVVHLLKAPLPSQSARDGNQDFNTGLWGMYKIKLQQQFNTRILILKPKMKSVFVLHNTPLSVYSLEHTAFTVIALEKPCLLRSYQMSSVSVQNYPNYFCSQPIFRQHLVSFWNSSFCLDNFPAIYPARSQIYPSQIVSLKQSFSSQISSQITTSKCFVFPFVNEV